ncbi:uncharacterized protein L203_102233 [Cryptococcus depauperatus CBS 7841]|uniref:DUF292-domain-containing protein n=1 Tax=Cryptococcus depauperatus CBS 7841 TaxID=1295531 RepID=A0AAJ8JRJ5_9TREE
MAPWNGPRTKVQIRLAIQRLKTLQEKKHALAKASRREIADLLAKGRVETCRLRVEGLIQDDIYVELLELLELYSEMLQARFNILEASSGTEPDPSISEAVCAIVYAAPRTELKELQVLRDILMHKYGRNFALTLLPSDPPPASVPPRVSAKLTLYTPSKELVDAYLWEIAKGYGIDWAPESSTSSAAELKKDSKVDDGKPEDKEEHEKSPEQESEPTETKDPTKKLTEEEELAKRFERLKNL